MKGQTDSNTINQKTSILHFQQWTDCPDKKISKKTLNLNNTLKQMDQADIQRAFHLTAAD
jgi:hypothetical protein